MTWGSSGATWCHSSGGRRRSWSRLKSVLKPSCRDHPNNRELFDVTLRLLVNLTNPELLLFKEELPEDKETRNFYLQIQTHRQSYKVRTD